MRGRLEAQIVKELRRQVPRQASVLRQFVVLVRRRSAVARKTGRPEYASIRTAQFLGSDFARRTCCKPSRLVLVASPPLVAALLIGSKGVLNPKAQVQAPSRRHALITARDKRPLKYGVPDVIETSSTET